MRLLEAGERAPDFVLPGPGGGPARFYSHAGGRPTAMVFTESPSGRDEELGARLQSVDGVQVWWVVPDRSLVPPGAAGWLDADGAVRDQYGIESAEAAVVVLDANLRVVAALTGPGAVEDAVIALRGAASRDGEPPPTVSAQAPVLFVPEALPDPLRLRLINEWESAGAAGTGVEKSIGGARLDAIDDGVKRRRDHTVADPLLQREIVTAVGRRLLPELQKAFAFRATRFEGFKIACYESATGGFFRPHRDNLSPSTAHRVFAMTLNLNDDYTGGELRFPEYGSALYRPAAGAAIVFSCSQLHEALDVTAGRRFVLLSFLYAGDAAR